MVAHHFSVICPVQGKSTSTFRNKTEGKLCHIALNLGNREQAMELQQQITWFVSFL